MHYKHELVWYLNRPYINPYLALVLGKSLTIFHKNKKTNHLMNQSISPLTAQECFVAKQKIRSSEVWQDTVMRWWNKMYKMMWNNLNLMFVEVLIVLFAMLLEEQSQTSMNKTTCLTTMWSIVFGWPTPTKNTKITTQIKLCGRPYFCPTRQKHSICISDFIQNSFFYLERFLQKLADVQCSSIN